MIKIIDTQKPDEINVKQEKQKMIIFVPPGAPSRAAVGSGEGAVLLIKRKIRRTKKKLHTNSVLCILYIHTINTKCNLVQHSIIDIDISIFVPSLAQPSGPERGSAPTERMALGAPGAAARPYYHYYYYY